MKEITITDCDYLCRQRIEDLHLKYHKNRDMIAGLRKRIREIQKENDELNEEYRFILKEWIDPVRRIGKVRYYPSEESNGNGQVPERQRTSRV